MNTFLSITKHHVNDGAIEGAGSTFTTDQPFTVSAKDFTSADKITLVVSQHNGVSPATGHITYPGKGRRAYSVIRTAPLLACSHGFANTNAWPTGLMRVRRKRTGCLQWRMPRLRSTKPETSTGSLPHLSEYRQ
jgi:hypothetical protein